MPWWDRSVLLATRISLHGNGTPFEKYLFRYFMGTLKKASVTSSFLLKTGWELQCTGLEWQPRTHITPPL